MFSDPTLTMESLVGVMEKVTSDEGRRRKVWDGVLGWDYVTPSSYLDEVYLKYSTAEEKTYALADVYVNSRPGSSWQHLVQILYGESEMAAAKEAKSFIQQQIGGLCDCVHTCTCTCIYTYHVSIFRIHIIALNMVKADCPLRSNSMTLQILNETGLYSFIIIGGGGGEITYHC